MFSWLAHRVVSFQMARLREGDMRPVLLMDAPDVRLDFPGDSSWAPEWRCGLPGNRFWTPGWRLWRTGGESWPSAWRYRFQDSSGSPRSCVGLFVCRVPAGGRWNAMAR